MFRYAQHDTAKRRMGLLNFFRLLMLVFNDY